MFRNFIISAFRNLVQNKVQSIIQIFSLTIGLTIFAMITLYLYDELTVDRSNEHFEQIYRLENRERTSGSRDAVSSAMGPIILQNIPDVLNMTRIRYETGIYISYSEEAGEPATPIAIDHFLIVDSSFQDIFPQEYLLGDPRSSLNDPLSIVLTESLAQKLFGSENPIGKTVIAWRPRIVTGVIKDPVNTHLRFESLITISSWYINKIKTGGIQNELQWLMGQTSPTYITLHKNADKDEVLQKIEDTWVQFGKDEFEWEDWDPGFSLCPLKEVHFTDIDPWKFYMSIVEKKVLMNFFLIGLVILLLGIINYINLTTARATLRNREISIKKIVGSSRFKLIVYFLIESVITTSLSFLMSVLCLLLFFPWFNNLLQTEINLYFLSNPLAWIFILFSILSIGILSGVYPAIRMSSRSPVVALTGNTKGSGRGLVTRRILMLMQFTVAVILMIGILFMHIQIRYMKKQDLGFDAEHIVWTGTGSWPVERKLLLLSRLDKYPEIEKACLSWQVPGNFTDNSNLVDDPGTIWHGLDLEAMSAGPYFFDVYDLQITHGAEILDQISKRGFTRDTSRTAPRYCYINETCRKALQLEDPVGYHLEGRWFIGGVFKDFHFQSLQFPIKPLSIWLIEPGEGWFLSMKINSPNIHNTLREIDEEFHDIPKTGENLSGINPPPVIYNFIDDFFNEQYSQVQRVHDASVYFSILAMILACMGLFGLSSFVAQRRTKEIGIRKVMGSSERQVFMLLAKDFALWVLLSVLIGCPIGWYFMDKWQQQFAYKASVGIWVYVVTALIAFGIAFLTVARQSLKAARANPADSLRDE